MDFYRYAQECGGFVLELKESLTTKDIDVLRADCAALGPDEWLRWNFSNLKPICTYVCATPLQRQKKKAWQEPILRGRLVLAAIQHIMRAHNLLDGIEQHFLPQELSYREMASRAGEAYLNIFFGQDVFGYWPFDGPGPFDAD